MQSDEREIRELARAWITASKAGDVATVLSLMTDDAIFLIPGRAPMFKPEFAAAMRAQGGAGAPAMEIRSEIQEVAVSGDLAFMWGKLTVIALRPDGVRRVVRDGHTLSVLKNIQGKWLLARDANLLAVVPD
jgi:uncharacterized protein (TIGR02246 family)